MAPTVESSHCPVGVPVKTPLRARASWISVIRSGVGAAWPFTFLVFLWELREFAVRVDFFPEVAEEERVEGVLCEELRVGTALLADECLAAEDTLDDAVALPVELPG